MSNKSNKSPERWKQVSIQTVLGDAHFQKFFEIWNRVDGNMDAAQKALLEYLQPFKDDFTARGYDIGWVSYAVTFHAAKADHEAQKTVAADSAVDITESIMREHKAPRAPRSQWS